MSLFSFVYFSFSGFSFLPIISLVFHGLNIFNTYVNSTDFFLSSLSPSHIHAHLFLLITFRYFLGGSHFLHASWKTKYAYKMHINVFFFMHIQTGCHIISDQYVIIHHCQYDTFFSTLALVLWRAQLNNVFVFILCITCHKPPGKTLNLYALLFLLTWDVNFPSASSQMLLLCLFWFLSPFHFLGYSYFGVIVITAVMVYTLPSWERKFNIRMRVHV